MNSEQKDTYYIAVKLFVEEHGKLLILRDNFRDWDLPGGRIKKDEFDVSLEEIIKRKIIEELGGEVQLEVGEPLIFMRHERVEAAPGSPTVRIFAIGYPAKIIKGEIVLSPRHTEKLWVDEKDFKPEDYFTGGWLKGVQDFLAIRRKQIS